MIWAKRKDLLLPVALGLCLAATILALALAHIKPSRSLNILIFGYSMLWCLSFGKRRLRFAAGVVALLIASSLYTGPFGHILDTERSFFGVSRVTNDPNGKLRYLFHGGTTHGVQNLDTSRSREPLAYYTNDGPAGQIFRAAQAEMPDGRWAIVGLGAGALACDLQPRQTLTFYEIDPLVARIAKNPRYFTFLEQCAPDANIVLGDARLELRSAPEAQYGMIIVDAFSGDSIPMHLVTREALALYLRKLAPGGILAFHITNLYLHLGPILGDLAQDAHLTCMIESDTLITEAQIDAGRFPSVWVVMARSPDRLAGLTAGANSSTRWVPLHGRIGKKVWTDDYSNLLSAIQWN